MNSFFVYIRARNAQVIKQIIPLNLNTEHIGNVEVHLPKMMGRGKSSFFLLIIKKSLMHYIEALHNKVTRPMDSGPDADLWGQGHFRFGAPQQTIYLLNDIANEKKELK